MTIPLLHTAAVLVFSIASQNLCQIFTMLCRVYALCCQDEEDCHSRGVEVGEKGISEADLSQHAPRFGGPVPAFPDKVLHRHRQIICSSKPFIDIFVEAKAPRANGHFLRGQVVPAQLVIGALQNLHAAASSAAWGPPPSGVVLLWTKHSGTIPTAC